MATLIPGQKVGLSVSVIHGRFAFLQSNYEGADADDRLENFGEREREKERYLKYVAATFCHFIFVLLHL
jgi:hypothetical protein